MAVGEANDAAITSETETDIRGRSRGPRIIGNVQIAPPPPRRPSDTASEATSMTPQEHDLPLERGEEKEEDQPN